MKKTVLIYIGMALLFALLVFAIYSARTSMMAADDWAEIGTGEAKEFELVAAPVDKYDEIKVEITADQVSGVMAPTVVWQGVIPEDALFYQAMLVDSDMAYDLTLTVREDGIGCLPTNFPHELTIKVYGRNV